MGATRVIRWADLTVTPWKNGGGRTREIAGAPAGAGIADFAWRVSVAEVEDDGPFSAFPGVDRQIMLIDGTVMVLDVDGTEHRLAPFSPLAFPGDAATLGSIPSGPTRDLNLMTRRGHATGTMRAVPVDAAAPYRTPVDTGGVLVLLALTDGLVLQPTDPTDVAAAGGGHVLSRLDAVIQDQPGPVCVSGAGMLAQIRVDVPGRD
ncbi:HutD family protein [Actinospica durhamensis]|uniref:HutD family protein n=1 Tax=Actinospica durhamensis TaxID=1508375 RepID=A0A941IPI4_9ACTN|nr:HutD family protein [Actinospica durhamensis]MBR7835169.1 HutD family protein [Actinospica durhamensis]